MSTHTCSDGCDCCAADRPLPAAIANRPGLDAIAYRIGTHPDIKQSLLAALSSSDAPSLRGLRTRDDRDFTIALCDAVAVMTDTLTFYQERIANEGYLRTATEPLSIHELAALIGYRPAPGVGAAAHLAFKVEDAPGAPEQAPRTVAIPSGTRVQNVPSAGEKPVAFETSAAIVGRPEWNALRPRLTQPHLPKQGSTDVVLAGTGHNLKVGDVMLFVGDERIADPSNPRWVTRVLKTIDAQPENNRTVVTWQDPIGPAYAAQNVRAFVFRQRAAIFGHSAPDWSGQPDSYKASYLGMQTPDQLKREDRFEWPDYNIFAPDPDRKTTHGRLITPRPDDVARIFDEAVKAALLAQGKDMAGAIVGAIGNAGNAIIQPIQNIITSVTSLFRAASLVPKALEEAWNETIGGVFKDIGKLGEDFGKAVSDAGDSIVKGLKDIFSF